MRISKAVVTAAAPNQSTLPLQRLVDRDGAEKTSLQLIIEEVLDAGIEEICVVICPGRQADYEHAAGPYTNRLVFVEQDNPRGYGDALYRARDFTDGQAFLHLVGDHLYLSGSDNSCACQLVEVASAEASAVSGVQPTRENKLPYFGAVGGRRIARRNDLFEVRRVAEKPTPTQAEQELVIAGLRAGHYLCLFGMHVLTPTIMDLLETAVADSGPTEAVALSPALSRLAERERYLAMSVDGRRYNIGIRYGLLIAQLALGLSGRDRDRILTELVELLALNQ